MKKNFKEEAVVRCFTPLENSIIIEVYASNGCTEYSKSKKGFKKSDSV